MSSGVKTLLIVIGVSLVFCVVCGIIGMFFIPFAAVNVTERVVENVVEDNPELEQILEDSGIDTENLNLDDLLNEDAIESVMGNVVIEDPEQAQEVAQSIASYQLPAGYAEEMALDVMGFKMAMITNNGEIESSDFAIMLIQAPANMFSSDEQLQTMLESGLSQQGDRYNMAWEEISQEEVFVNGTATILKTYEVTSEDDGVARQATMSFETEEGNPALVMFTGKAETWDQAAIDTFINSLRGTGR